jgi:SAM-dependent methyltransferase
MHQSARKHMALCVDEYLPTEGRLRIVDLGSRVSSDKHQTHRELFDEYDCEYIGVDILDGPNVDVVMPKPYRIPVRSSSADLVISGQVFEHIPFFWASITEIARVLKPSGHAFITAPSRGHVHNVQDCWRFYPDGMRALAAWSGLELLEAFTEFPPRVASTAKHDYSAIDAAAYWGDTVGVFRKPNGYSRVRMAVVRRLTVGWANHVGGIDHIPMPTPLPRRRGRGRRPARRGER